MKTREKKTLKKVCLLVLFAVACFGSTAIAAEEGGDALYEQSNLLFILLGAIMILATHGGFAFLEVGSVRKKNQVNAHLRGLFDECSLHEILEVR